MLTVTALAVGDATITVNADDGRGGTVHDAFDLTVSTSVAVVQIEEDLPSKFTLEQNYPNPFSQTTNITFTLSQASSVFLKVYDLMGGDVTILISGDYQSGRHEVTWNASEYHSGVYIYQLQTGTDVERRIMLLLR